MTKWEIICIYLVGYLTCLLALIWYQRKEGTGMTIAELMGSVAFSLLSYAGFMVLLIAGIMLFIGDRGDNTLLESYSSIIRRRKENWDK